MRLPLTIEMSLCMALAVTRLSSDLNSRLHELATVEAMVRSSGSPRDILQPRHAASFVEDKLFDEFAKTLCTACAVPQKELFESWATALYVHDRFSMDESHRIADLASGHGLLSWALLLLGEKDERTAVCVDRRMPKSAEKVAEAMTKRWPHLHDRWDFVESKLDNVIPANSTLLCGVHACGVLSDQIISLALHGNSPLALVPCCHSKKSLYCMDLNELKRKKEGSNLSNFVDSRRIQRLQEAGFSVERRKIPEQFTPKNTIIMASPPVQAPCTNEEAKSMMMGDVWLGLRTSSPSSCSSSFQVPVGNDATSIGIVKNLSGRLAATIRKQPPAPSLCISLLIPHITYDQKLISPALLAEVATEHSKPHVQAKVEYADNEAFLHASGMYARTFKVTYISDVVASKAITKENAMHLLQELGKVIPVAFPGCRVR